MSDDNVLIQVKTRELLLTKCQDCFGINNNFTL